MNDGQGTDGDPSLPALPKKAVSLSVKVAGLDTASL